MGEVEVVLSEEVVGGEKRVSFVYEFPRAVAVPKDSP